MKSWVLTLSLELCHDQLYLEQCASKSRTFFPKPALKKTFLFAQDVASLKLIYMGLIRAVVFVSVVHVHDRLSTATKLCHHTICEIA